ncbi:MAG: sulfur carrier protein ThiS [Candidatus Methanomethylophilus sp.]|nr:sulfur carrier protein ThiS [Methanomethylophilus sp.]MDD3232671.1 sulfur carrier protein ThiS [Methanomethylophilus sp.]MDD4669251.1 sulfur carrier protein ThiS [Methanomethylophilus sp.]
MKANGAETGDPGGQTLQAWLARYGYDQTRVAVERNGQIVRRRDFGRTVLSVSDTLEIVSFVGGG